MAFMSYWNLGLGFVNVMLIVGPTGYLTALVMYKLFSERCLSNSVYGTPADPEKEEGAAYRFTGTTKAETATAGTKLPNINTKEPVHMYLYHALPLLRMYLVIKDTESNDVECLFRANSLSSFTLGTSQLVGMLFTVIMDGEFDLFMKINVGSFCIHWLITLMYFTTAVPGRIKSAVESYAMKYNSTRYLINEFAMHKKLSLETAKKPHDAPLQRQFEAWRSCQIAEIEALTSVKIDDTNKTALRGADGAVVDAHGNSVEDIAFTDLELMYLRRLAHIAFNDKYRQVAVGC